MALKPPQDPAQKKRLNEWKAWLNGFKKDPSLNGKKITYIENAAWLLNELYWRITAQYLRPILSTNPEEEEIHRIHPYKIISASEITIMMTEPIQAETKEITQQQNALLAWYVATQILEGWKVDSNPLITAKEINEVAGYKEYITATDRYPESFAAEHIKWLSLLNVTIEKPIIINAQCWRMFYVACLSLLNKGKLD